MMGSKYSLHLVQHYTPALYKAIQRSEVTPNSYNISFAFAVVSCPPV